MISGVSCSMIRAISSGPQSTARRPGICSTSCGQRAPCPRGVAADQDVLVEVVLEVGEQRGADRVKGRDDAHAVGGHLLRLLGGGALPDAERAGRLAADRGGERDGRVDQQLALAQRVLEVRQRLRLAAERDAEDDELGLAARRRRCAAPVNASVRDRRSRAVGGLRARGRRRASRSRSGRRSRPSRSARPKPSAPVAPTMQTGFGTAGESMDGYAAVSMGSALKVGMETTNEFEVGGAC